MDIVSDIIDNYDVLCLYFIPGAIGLKVLYFIINEKGSDFTYYIYKSILLSAIIVKSSNFFLSKWEYTDNLIVSIIIAIIFGYGLGQLKNSDKYQNFLGFLNINRTTRRFWPDIISFDKGRYMDVMLENEPLIYYGYIVLYEEKDDGSVDMCMMIDSIRYEQSECVEKQKEGHQLIFNTSKVSKIFIYNN